MRDDYIERKMRELADSRDIIPIAGRERGSRMIGVEHDDSDWDAFLLFAQPAEEYAVLSGYTDTVSKKYDGGDLDIHGWNVQKLGKLGQDSNPNATEFLMSEKTYFNDLESDILERLEEEMLYNFNHMALYHHYLSLARSNYEKYIASGNDRTFNRQFYVLRATLMSKHIRKEGSFPALDVWDFISLTTAPTESEWQLLKDLSAKKANGELGQAPDLVGDPLRREQDAEMDPTDERINQPDKELFNELIRASVE